MQSIPENRVKKYVINRGNVMEHNKSLFYYYCCNRLCTEETFILDHSLVDTIAFFVQYGFN